MKLSKDTNILIVGLGLLGGSYAEAQTVTITADESLATEGMRNYL